MCRSYTHPQERLWGNLSAKLDIVSMCMVMKWVFSTCSTALNTMRSAGLTLGLHPFPSLDSVRMAQGSQGTCLPCESPARLPLDHKSVAGSIEVCSVDKEPTLPG